MVDSRQDTRIKFSILKHYGVLSTDSRGWAKELNLVSWNDREGKYDIRSWSPDRKKMGRGVTLSGEECAALRMLLNTRFPSDIDDLSTNPSPTVTES
ncbi:MAG: PC4/YdbC family ssDNA-binding protein [Sporolactobacillus sp.]